MGDIDHIRDQRTKLKEEIRKITQEIDELSVRQLFVPLTTVSTRPFLGHGFRTSRN